MDINQIIYEGFRICIEIDANTHIETFFREGADINYCESEVATVGSQFAYFRKE